MNRFQCENLCRWLVVGMKWRTINHHSIQLTQYRGDIFPDCILSYMHAISPKSIQNVPLISFILALAFLSLCPILIHTLQGGDFQLPKQFNRQDTPRKTIKKKKSHLLVSVKIRKSFFYTQRVLPGKTWWSGWVTVAVIYTKQICSTRCYITTVLLYSDW